MSILVTFLVAILVGMFVWFVARMVPFTSRYAQELGVMAFIITILIRLSGM